MLLRQTLVALLVLPTLAIGWEFRGETGLEGRYFTQDSPYQAADYSTNGSVYLKGEVFHEWNNRDDQFIFIPYARVDENDSERTHVDIRELSWIHVGSGWESRVGIRKVFWGVTEGRHLVDIINQTDLVDQVDGEEKLGQPMLNLSTVRDWGIVDLFVLPGFRERTYAGEEGRPRTPLPVSDDARYESGAEDKRVDVGFRYQQYFNNGLQLALSHFSGTSREPLLLPQALSPQQLQSLLLTGSLPAGSDPELVLAVEAGGHYSLWPGRSLQRPGRRLRVYPGRRFRQCRGPGLVARIPMGRPGCVAGVAFSGRCTVGDPVHLQRCGLHGDSRRCDLRSGE